VLGAVKGHVTPKAKSVNHAMNNDLAFIPGGMTSCYKLQTI
jgi:hypothetical protein